MESLVPSTKRIGKVKPKGVMMRLPSHLFRGLTYIGVAANSDRLARSRRIRKKLLSLDQSMEGCLTIRHEHPWLSGD